MLAEKSYKAVKNLANSIGICAEDEKLWFDTTYVRLLLNEYGIAMHEGKTPRGIVRPHL